MPNFESNALYIDFSRMPPPKVIEEIDYEILLKRYQNQVVTRKPDLSRAVNLEQSPTNVILQAEAYGEMIVRQRINSAALSVMLPFATGTDLEALGALYGVYRLSVPNADPNGNPTPESDDRLRHRIQLAPEAFASAGSAGGYIYHALTADPTLRDVSAASISPGQVRVTLMNSGDDPTATQQQIDNVRKVILSPKIKPLTDMVSVVSVQRIDTPVVANVTLYPGPDASLIMSDITKAMVKLRERIGVIGRDLTRAALFSALYQEGVQDVDLVSPMADIEVDLNQCVWITSATVNVLSNRME